MADLRKLGSGGEKDIRSKSTRGNRLRGRAVKFIPGSFCVYSTRSESRGRTNKLAAVTSGPGAQPNPFAT